MASFEGGNKIAVVNASRVDFDHNIDWTSLGQNASVFYDEAGEDPTDETIIERADGCDVLVTKEITISKELIERLPVSLKLICEAGTGYNNIALDACRQKGLLVMNVPSYSTDAVASLVMTFLLNLSCSLVVQQRSLAEGDRSNFTSCLQVPHFEVAGKTLGLIGGRGSIGSKVAEIARAFGINVIVSTRNPPVQVEPSEDSTPPSCCATIEYTMSVEDLLQRSDFVSLHCPLNNETRHLINAKTLALMKSTAYLINTARGALVDENALVEALTSGTIAGVALDVQDPEPPHPSSPLYTLNNVILTPHIGWKRLETRQRLVDAVAANIQSFRAGVLQNVVS